MNEIIFDKLHAARLTALANQPRNRRWTARENALLMDLFPRHTVPEIAAILGRAKDSVQKHIQAIGLSRDHVPVIERFMARVEKQVTGCWLWRGAVKANGYGSFTTVGKTWQAHRFSYEVVAAKPTPKRTLHHTCQNRQCVNPDHLVNLDYRDHMLITPGTPFHQNAIKTHCIRGHAFTDENTDIRDGKHGVVRHCRICQRAARRSRYEREKSNV